MIFLDADACPVKDYVYRVAVRYALPLTVVANVHIRIPEDASSVARMEVVPGTPDAADDWIAERSQSGDLVITADIPLAARAIERGSRAIDFRGNEFNPSRIGDALASRELNQLLRMTGEITRGPAAFSQQDRSRFASMMDAMGSRMRRELDALSSRSTSDIDD